MSTTAGKSMKEPPPPSTNKVILDYLLYLSIQSRLKEDRTRHSLLNNDERAVDSIVAGILATSHASNQHNNRSDAQTFQQRLHLCQLAHTMGRPKRLTDAIPWFLKTTADLVRRALDLDEPPVLFFAGQKDMGVGMPSRWYDLFLSLLTQAALQNSHSGEEPIVEIFSYGMIHDDEDEDGSCDDEDDDDDDDVWHVNAADYHLLFPKTRTMFRFKAQVLEREKEILDGQHAIETLVKRYPLNTFQRDMREFIQMALTSMDAPVLDNFDGPLCDGSLLMPGDVDEPQSVVMSSLLVKQEAAAVTAIASASGSSIKRTYESSEEQDRLQKKPKH